MGTFLSDLKYGVRLLAKSPGFTAVAAAALALGIGANMAIFSMVNAILLRPLPYRDPDRLVLLRESSQRLPSFSVSYPNFLDWREQNHVFMQMSAFHWVDFTLTGSDHAEDVPGAGVSSSFLATLGVEPILGRDFLPGDDRPQADPVAVISYGLWQRRFGADRTVLGRTLRLDDRPYAVIGVLPRKFKAPVESEVYVPIALQYKELTERGAHHDTSVFARLRAGLTIEEARVQMDAIAQRLEREYPSTNAGSRVRIEPLREEFVGNARPALLILFGAVGFVLLIACANVANLLLARGVARRKEIGVRFALGASRFRVVRQLITESIILALLGGSLGLLLGSWAIDGLRTAIPRDQFQGAEAGIDGSVVGFTLLTSLMTGLVCGLAPALQTSRVQLSESLKEGGRTSRGVRRRLPSFLVVVEVALALILVSGAGLMIRSLRYLLQVDPGFNPRNVLAMQLSLRGSRYSDPREIPAFCRQLLEQLRSLPGVEGVAVASELPLTHNHSRGDIYVEGSPVPAPGHFPHPDFHIISADYPRVMGLPVLRGRSLAETDDEKSPEVALISEGLARHYWNGQDPIGKRFTLGRPAKDARWVSVVGIVRETRQYGLEAAVRDELYLSYLQHPKKNLSFVVRVASNPGKLAGPARDAVHFVEKDQPISDLATMEQVLTESIATQRVTMVLLGIFASLALVLAIIGVYGVMSQSVVERTHEIGVRVALGAAQKDVLGLVVGRGMLLGLAGVIAGITGAMLLTRFLSTLLYGVSPTDPATLVSASVVLSGVALLASYLPARRAARLDPMAALRCE